MSQAWKGICIFNISLISHFTAWNLGVLSTFGQVPQLYHQRHGFWHWHVFNLGGHAAEKSVSPSELLQLILLLHPTFFKSYRSDILKREIYGSTVFKYNHFQFSQFWQLGYTWVGHYHPVKIGNTFCYLWKSHTSLCSQGPPVPGAVPDQCWPDSQHYCKTSYKWTHPYRFPHCNGFEIHHVCTSTLLLPSSMAEYFFSFFLSLCACFLCLLWLSVFLFFFCGLFSKGLVFPFCAESVSQLDIKATFIFSTDWKSQVPGETIQLNSTSPPQMRERNQADILPTDPGLAL